MSISQEQLALQVEKRQTTIGNWENKISEPSINEVVTLSNFFGISLDDLVLKDLEAGKVISEDYVSSFQQKGKVIGKENGKVMGKLSTSYAPHPHTLSTLKENDESLAWAVMKVLKEMDGKIDLLRAGVEEIKKNKL